MGVERSHRGSVEKIVLLVIFVGLLAFLGANFAKERRHSKEQALYLQLAQMRQGINLFQMMEKRYPANLVELATSIYKMPNDDTNHRYVDVVSINELGQVVDPFNSPYEYMAGKGWVKSTTEGYTSW